RAAPTEKTTPTPLWIYAAWSFLALAVLVNVARCFTPVTAFDTLTYHLAVPKIYLSLHSISHLPSMTYSEFPLTAQLTYLYALAAGAPSGASFIHAGFAILTATMLYSWSSRVFSPSVAIIATLIFYMSPMIGLESVSPLVDLIAVFYGSIAIACLVPVSPPAKDADHHALCALFIGIAISTKWTCAPVAILIGAWAIARSFSALRQTAQTERAEYFLRLLPRAAALLLLAGLPSIPYFIKSFLYLGNPVWPVFTSVFGSGEFSLDATARLTSFIYNQLSIERTIPNLLALPWNMTMNEWRYAGPIAPMFLCFIPLYSIVKKNPNVSFLISFIVLFFPIFFFALDPQLRYLMPI
ncbi:MAG: hypothetical protein KAG97_12315, partial [Victivallales bacterium]|nr:hypothetical protein [Victivallales bacterium]